MPGLRAAWCLAGFLLLSTAPLHANPTVTRTPAEVEQLIEQAGRSAPAWWDSVALRYPSTLDLTWQTRGNWNAQRHLAHYLWDVIYPNPGRWREGARLLHHAMVVNKDDPRRLARTMGNLAFIYAELLYDYPRAAFWARKSDQDDLLLAQCYWQMGCKQLAVDTIRGMEDDTSHGGIIRLWAHMGELPTALRIAEDTALDGRPDVGWLAAGDSCRLAGRNQEALAYYAKVAALVPGPREGRIKQNRERAIEAMQAVRLASALERARLSDGEYRGSSIAYAGPMEVAVTIKDGRIQAVRVVRHVEKQPFGALKDIPVRIIQKQSVQGIDATSAATITSDALLNAATKALHEAAQRSGSIP
jgi:uncharacterized protein with FMN-binding domain